MNTVQYKCPYCGGELVFNPEKQQFSCPYCASDFTEAEMEARYKEQNAEAQEHADPDAKTLTDENDTAHLKSIPVFTNVLPAGDQIIAEETTSATLLLLLPQSSCPRRTIDWTIPARFCSTIRCSAGCCGTTVQRMVQKAVVSAI